ncbi:uncharacterized protein LOC135674639 isoform X2 [Musa acuminata AAA Group]|uniref:uncharacterized protein LOC103986512 isoform X2 n=1 Tax=Musa acuminata AAA Group TaxID=214697 RepID=UPI0031CE1A7E
MDVSPSSFGDALATGDCLAATWDYHEIFLQQTIEDLKHKLTCTNMELEALRTNAHEELQKAKESNQQLIELLELRTSERDEARNQLQLLLNQIGQPSLAGLPRVLPL